MGYLEFGQHGSIGTDDANLVVIFGPVDANVKLEWRFHRSVLSVQLAVKMVGPVLAFCEDATPYGTFLTATVLRRRS